MQRPLAPSWPTTVESTDTISIGEIVSSLLQRRLLIISSALIAALLGYLHVTSIVDTYTSSTEVMLYPQRERVLASEEMLPSRNPDDAMIATEIEIIRSRTMAERIVSSFELENHPDWNGASPARRGIKLWLSNIFENKDAVPLTDRAKRRNAIDKVLSMTKAEQVRDSFVISIQASAFEPTLAADIANLLRDSYIQSQLDFTNASSSHATSWFQSRLDQLEGDLQRKENTAASFRESQDLLATSGSTLTEQQVRDTQEAVSEARASLLDKEAQLEQVKQAANSSDRLSEIGLAVGSAQVAELRRRQAESSALLAELSSKYGKRHPEFTIADAEAKDLQRQIDEELQRIIADVQSKVDVAQKRLVLAEQDRARYEGRLARNNRSHVRLNELEREASSTRDIYEDYSRRFQEVNDQASLGMNAPVRVIAEAVEPSHSDTPSLALSLLACFALGGIMGVGSAFTINAMDDRIRTKIDVDRTLEKPVFGVIPIEKSSYLENLKSSSASVGIGARLLGRPAAPWDILLRKRFSRFSEAFRLIHKNVEYHHLGEDAPIVTITSAVPDEGKTTASICFARCSAMSGRKTLLIDCDTYTRTVTQSLEIGDDKVIGLKAALELDEYTSLDTITCIDDPTGLHVLGCLPDDKHTDDLFSKDSLKNLLERASKEFDIVILDTPPVLALSDSIAASSVSSQTILVTRSGITPARIATAAIQQLESSGGRVGGIVLNGVNSDSLGLFRFGDKDFYRQIQRSYYPD